MTETATDNSGPRDRSPAFPSIPLEAALRRLVEFETHFKRSPARPEKIGDAWGVKGKAYVDRTSAALRYFGLIEYQGTGAARQVVVSDEGRKYLRSQQESTKQEVIKAAALRPKQIALLWGLWGSDRPADAACLDDLMLKHRFSDGGARDFLRVYDATIGFAGLSGSDKVAVVEQESSEGVMAPPAQAMAVSQSANPSSVADRLLDEVVTSVQYPKARSPMLQEIFNLNEGPVTLSFPSALSRESYEDLKDQLELFLRRAQRRARSSSRSEREGEDEI
jgi:hypothetical protein